MPAQTHLAAFRALLVVLLTACSPAERGDSIIDEELRGGTVDPPYEKLDFTLTNQEGEPFRFRHETEGFITLLFFGYTHCPDVCPVHMTNIAAALDKLTPTQVSQIKVVFVTTDPARDTPERLTEWLGAIDASFIGLTGSEEELDEILRAMRMPEINQQHSEHGYDVIHAAHVIAYTRDNIGRLIYPFGTRQVDWVHDLSRLTDGA